MFKAIYTIDCFIDNLHPLIKYPAFVILCGLAVIAGMSIPV